MRALSSLTPEVPMFIQSSRKLLSLVPSLVRPALSAMPLVALTVAGCDSQAGSDYPGEPLATLEGTVTVADSTEVPTSAEATIVWHVWQDGDSANVTESAAIEGEFPAAFTLGIYEPPPEVSRFDLGEEDESLAGVHLATGYVTVMPSGDAGGSMSEVFESALGVETELLLVWADGEIPAGFLRFTDAIQPGYQLFRAIEVPGAAEAKACIDEVAECFDACTAEHCVDDETCGPGLDACIGECPDPSLCPEYDPKVSLERVALDTSLSIVLGGPKEVMNWY
jgi:hypothetical protein